MWKSSFPTCRYGIVASLGNREINLPERKVLIMRVINMTPHAVNLLGQDDQELATFQPSGNLIRLSTTTVPAGEITVDGVVIPLTTTAFGDPEGLPSEEDGTMYIVSALVKSALPSRKDLVVPNEAVRDDQGRIVGCRSLGV